jgi:hypothetical protein
VGLLGVSNCGVIRCLVDSMIVGLVYGFKVCLFRVSSGVGLVGVSSVSNCVETVGVLWVLYGVEIMRALWV